VGVYIDDVYMGRAVGAAMEFRDIANVQILRGPQGTCSAATPSVARCC
jgi:iron complex outermembrane receptor protein